MTLFAHRRSYVTGAHTQAFEFSSSMVVLDYSLTVAEDCSYLNLVTCLQAEKKEKAMQKRARTTQYASFFACLLPRVRNTRQKYRVEKKM